MTQTMPRVRELARHLLLLETPGVEQAEAEVSATMSALAKLCCYLTKLIGAAGFEVLLARALALARAEAGWLAPVRVQSGTKLTGFQEAALQQPADAVVAGCIALMVQLIGLLVAFVGENLTLRLLHDVWPEMRSDAWNSCVEETPE